MLAGPVHAAEPEGPQLATYPRPDGTGRSGESCTLDRHCAAGHGCYVARQRCMTHDEMRSVHLRDWRGDAAFVIPVTIIGAGILATGSVFAARGNVPVAALTIPIGGLFTLIGIGGSTAIGIKRRQQEARMHELMARQPAR